MTANGVVALYVKALSENDNSKNQIYLGTSFEALQILPSGKLKEHRTDRSTTLKASVRFLWMTESGTLSRAPRTQLILYPKYPEVRLSGFLAGCEDGPSAYMQPTPAKRRKGSDGRYLVLGVSHKGDIIGYLAAPGTEIAIDLQSLISTVPESGSVILRIPFAGKKDPKAELLAAVTNARLNDWHRSSRLLADGRLIDYDARNAGGYTLEALFGIVPNGSPEPDYQDWEIKACSGAIVTLMTPEPDSGFYGDHGVEAFVCRYGHRSSANTLYFTGKHVFGTVCPTTGLKLDLIGMDVEGRRILSDDARLVLLDGDGTIAAAWSVFRLLNHWKRKHGRVLYVRYRKRIADGWPYFKFNPEISLAEGTDFELLIAAIRNGKIYLDPGSKVVTSLDGKTRVKARSQFRIKLSELAGLYRSLETVRVDK